MNMLEKQAAVKEHCIEQLTHNNHYPGYPVQRYMSDLVDETIPEGPWWTEHAVSLTQTFTPNIRVDEEGRPLHPWFKEIAQSVGHVAGRGEYWHWGPNFTADPIVITDESTPHILLVLRKNNSRWAFPGGFLDHAAEDTASAGARECREETAVELEQPTGTIYVGPVADERTTAHAWAYTNAKLWRPTEQQEVIFDPDEVKDAGWFAIDRLPRPLHGSHAKIIEFALKEL